MYILYSGCLATDLLNFHKPTTLRYYGNYVSEEYPTRCMVMCNGLLSSLQEQNPGYINCLHHWIYLLKIIGQQKNTRNFSKA